MKTVSLLFALALAQCSFGAEKTTLPKDLPPYGALKPYVPPPVTQHKLSNGLTLWMVPQRGFPKVALAIAVRGGMAADPKTHPGLSEFLMATLNQSTTTRSARQIAEELQDSGGDWVGEALPDSLLVSASVLGAKAEAALGVVADVLKNATFPESEVELARHNLSDSLRQREAEPRFLARRALALAMFGDHPYSVIAPTQNSIGETTVADLRREYARRFRPDQAVLVLVGDFEPPRMTAAVQKLFGGWSAPSGAALPSVPAPAKTPAHAIFAVPRPGSVQTTFLLGQFGPSRRDADYALAEIADAMYGGMFGSRLVKNIREDKGYTYSPGSILEARREVGVFRTRADVRNEVTGPTFNEIIYELNRMATTEAGKEELTMAERYLVGNQAISLQSQASLARELANLWMNDLPPARLAEESLAILKGTQQDVAALGRKYYSAARTTIVAVGQANVIQEQLAIFGLPINPVRLPDQPATEPATPK